MAEADHRPPRRTPRTNGRSRHDGALGERIRETRAEHGISLREMARRLDVSPSLVSQIETGKIHPSVRTLYAIVSELGVSLDDVFSPHARPPAPDGAAPPPAPPAALDGGDRPTELVQRQDERSTIDLESGVHWERLTTHNDRDVQFLFTMYPPGSESAPPDALVRHNGREFGLVLTGKLNVTIGFDDYVLGPGDSVSFDSTTPHRLHNDGDQPVTAVWFVVNRTP
jgi:transcriptional regulator with XRE-family HTH domain